MRVQGFYSSKKFSAQVQTLRKFIHEALGWDYAPDVTAPEILMPLRAVGILTSLSVAYNFADGLSGRLLEIRISNLLMSRPS